MKYISILLPLLWLTACKTPELAIVKVNEQFGCIDKKGNMSIAPVWDYILQDDKQLLVQKDSLYGFIDRKGRVLIPAQYTDAYGFYEGLAAVSNGEKYGFINLQGDTVIPFIYDDIFGGFSYGLCHVLRNDSCGYINRKGELHIPLQYAVCYPFTESYARVQAFEGESVLLDKSGKIYRYHEINKRDKATIEPPLDPYPGSFATPAGQGRVNARGDTLIPPIYKATGNLSDGMYIVQDQQGKWGAYTEKGALIIAPQFDKMAHFQEGLAQVKQNGKWGYVSKKGELRIAPVFDYAGPFKKGIAYAEYEGKAGFINKKGKFIIAPTFQPNDWKSNFE